MNKDIETTLDFLYPETPKFSWYQMSFRNKETSKVIWSPGEFIDSRCFLKDSRDFKTLEESLNSWYLGYTGRVYETNKVSQYQSSYLQTWVGIDIDDFIDYKKLPALPCSIRYSKSGNGLHLIFRVELKRYETGIKNNREIQETLRPYKEEIERKGIPVCKACFSVFYFFGGLNRWITQTDERISLVSLSSLSSQSLKTFGPTFPEEKLTREGRTLIGRLRDFGILPKFPGVPLKQQIYVKALYEALKGTSWEFQTKSTMGDNKGTHVNGFLTVSQGVLSIFTNADNSVVKQFLIGRLF